ncbi:hypothetical protein [Puerhibacterium sp. TATVAM-FAB25]|uniref:hypothetical protein n=1 Tax=Puerhibacterium sp. TATVAM-FAB25 TaxID=3093699 RepID=UPI0039787057
MRAPRHLTSVAVVVLTALVVGAVVLVSSLLPAYAPNEPEVLASGLDGGAGSTVGPGGDLYVVEPDAGELARVDLRTGEVETVATGLPSRRAGSPGGTVDVAFLGAFAYVLVSDADGLAGLYRIGAPGTVHLVADIGAWSGRHPPAGEYVVPTGVQDALERHHGSFLVSDGHHGRVLRVAPGNAIEELVAFGRDVVPTGLEAAGRSVLVAQAGPLPHLPHDGRLVAVHPETGATRLETDGAPLLVDVEGGPLGLYALSQGTFHLGNPAHAPADPRTGQVLVVGRGGALETVARGLDRPTSLEVVGDTAYVVTADGTVYTVALDVGAS